ncbi:FtsW/RodA/SpoVE family cell cycle protein [Iamia sp. SCSIO 61187]|uniref:FtsW/RodA/SpoVE family cell cycle protein n=1 Tax=Iamia sp. SCSIO 61187 TaxID=2722752 RepID=UPI001C62D56F|nr:FtsW/RodA/SpoVE family cell cycle protein [Iamia sp. SCSIO 61187]QYG91053.1 FtsW/RodA/SpoVE family cell cycle protein [Iamia sp. SCSIO 61187]
MIERLRRNAELTLLLMGVAVFGGAYALASLGRTASVPANVGPFLAVVVALFVVAHIAVRRLAPGADGTLLPLAGLLNGIGYVFIARLDQDLASRQALWTAVGILAFVATLFFVKRPRDLERYRYSALLAAIVLIMIPLLPILGLQVKGARIWIQLGPLTFQPGEVAKLCLAIFFAGYLVEKRELLALASWPKSRPILPDPKHLGPVLVAWGIALVVIMAERDLGTALLFFSLFMVMLWVSTGRARYLLVGFGLFGLGAFVSWLLFAHVQLRVTNWFDPYSDADGGGFQILQGWYAMADGGIAGRGLGLGLGNRVPEAENDFIFAIIGEELGLLGTTAILVAFLLLVGSGLRVAISQTGSFEKLLATGLTALMGIQAFIILGGVTRVLPLTGVVLPFVSFGGSALLANYVLLALLVRLSDDANVRAQRRARRSAIPVGAP